MRRGLTLLALALLAACSPGPKTAPPGASPQAAGPGDHTLTVTVGATERTFLLHVPPSYDPARAVPAVVTLHYRPGSGAAMRELTGFDAKADAEGFLVAYPEGSAGSSTRSAAAARRTTSVSSRPSPAARRAAGTPTPSGSSWPASPTAAT